MQGTVGLDADNLTAPFYSWMAVADDALVVPVAFDAFQNNECTDVLNHLTVYDGVVCAPRDLCFGGSTGDRRAEILSTRKTLPKTPAY